MLASLPLFVGLCRAAYVVISSRVHHSIREGLTMPFRFHRSIRIAPGLRLNLGRRAAHVSIGTRSIIAFSVLLASIAPTVPAVAADVMTLADLRAMCATPETEQQAACRFFILGAFQGLENAGGAALGVDGKFYERKAGKTFCVPDNLSQSVMVQKVVNLANADLKAFPEDVSMPAISFIAALH
jgi:hypothetical protein